MSLPVAVYLLVGLVARSAIGAVERSDARSLVRRWNAPLIVAGDHVLWIGRNRLADVVKATILLQSSETVPFVACSDARGVTLILCTRSDGRHAVTKVIGDRPPVAAHLEEFSRWHGHHFVGTPLDFAAFDG